MATRKELWGHLFNGILSRASGFEDCEHIDFPAIWDRAIEMYGRDGSRALALNLGLGQLVISFTDENYRLARALETPGAISKYLATLGTGASICHQGHVFTVERVNYDNTSQPVVTIRVDGPGGMCEYLVTTALTDRTL